ncbi:uncharacterized protein LOC143787911 isoform X2 [Ranitomeya variabilis]|uniref:uncharacterized protein LOC143787911 isoform X2 n=1 Tax=Ranitomeya variabilis TaxID=490064 RepID=UPI0040575649
MSWALLAVVRADVIQLSQAPVWQISWALLAVMREDVIQLFQAPVWQISWALLAVVRADVIQLSQAPVWQISWALLVVVRADVIQLSQAPVWQMSLLWWDTSWALLLAVVRAEVTQLSQMRTLYLLPSVGGWYVSGGGRSSAAIYSLHVAGGAPRTLCSSILVPSVAGLMANVPICALRPAAGAARGNVCLLAVDSISDLHSVPPDTETLQEEGHQDSLLRALTERLDSDSVHREFRRQESQ